MWFFYNCIIISNKLDVISYNIIDASNSVYNSIATNSPAGHKDYVYNKITSNSNHTIVNIDDVFKTFRVEGYNEEEAFELLDDVKSKYLGTDSTQIGIHGGSYPYSSITTNPQITKCIVDIFYEGWSHEIQCASVLRSHRGPAFHPVP